MQCEAACNDDDDDAANIHRQLRAHAKCGVTLASTVINKSLTIRARDASMYRKCCDISPISILSVSYRIVSAL